MFASRKTIILWQFLFILLSTTWLWAPHLNHLISSRVSLISEYEVAFQPYSWLFRLGDIAGAGLLGLLATYCLKIQRHKIPGWLLMTIAAGSAIDVLLVTNCHVSGHICNEAISWPFLGHAIETVATASAIFLLSAYDVWVHKRLISISFVLFQIGYGLLFLTQLASQNHFNTVSQFIYQTVLIVWIAWYGRDYLETENRTKAWVESRAVRYIFASWVFLNGILAVLVSLSDVNVFGRLKALYFAGDTAWLAQHGVVTGIIMLYLSRQLARGERRARQILLVIVGLETIKYSVVTPSPLLMSIYLMTFAALFVLRDYFDRGTITRTLRIHLKDALFMLGAVSGVAGIATAILFRTQEISDITTQSIDHFFDYTVTQTIISKSHIRPALLAHTISAFVLASIATITWILFRPYKHLLANDGSEDPEKIRDRLAEYSTSSEDFFKLWPEDKQYFWPQSGQGFIAYKTTGPIICALADPISATPEKTRLLHEFTDWARLAGLRICFLPIEDRSKKLYVQANLNLLQIGSSALVDRQKFISKTARDKWWRWKTNRAVKSGYAYRTAMSPHSEQLMAELRTVSDAWLTKDARRERGFALGYFDEDYLQQCKIHFLTDQTGRIVAFTNQVPSLRSTNTVTVDLLRSLSDADQAMPYLLLETIKSTDEYKYFDLSFVPFASTNKPLLKIAQAISASRFSAKGLEQFKNKFDPEWQPIHLAYDGDMADLALIAVNLEKIMKLE